MLNFDVLLYIYKPIVGIRTPKNCYHFKCVFPISFLHDLETGLQWSPLKWFYFFSVFHYKIMSMMTEYSINLKFLKNEKQSNGVGTPLPISYRVIHKSLRDFRTRLRNNQDRHGRKEHMNR